MALVSSGKDNSYGHPHKQVVDLLKRYIPEKQIYRTDNLGTLQFYLHEAYRQKW
jgi:competence protein ComEC